MNVKVAGIPVSRIVDKLGVRAAVAYAVVSALRVVYELPLWLCSSVGQGPFFAPAQFAWLPAFEAAFPAIRRELDSVLARKESLPNLQEVSPDQAIITDDDKWRTFVFFVFSNRVEKNCAACPETMRALEGIPQIRSAMFSILEPGKRIPPHCGPFKGILRLHLGLMVPDAPERCWIRVGDEVRSWQEGRGLVFDDTFEHEVRNDTGQTRVVLFIDLDRPLPSLAARYNEALIGILSRSSFVRNMVENAKRF